MEGKRGLWRGTGEGWKFGGTFRNFMELYNGYDGTEQPRFSSQHGPKSLEVQDAATDLLSELMGRMGKRGLWRGTREGWKLVMLRYHFFDFDTTSILYEISRYRYR